MSVFDDVRAHLRAIRALTIGVVRGISDDSIPDDPIATFGRWHDEAADSGLLLPESAALATGGPDGAPSVRMVLVKGVDERGFRFFTNYGSRKARELDANPRAALCVHWAVLERQVRVEGTVERLAREESAAYFASRSRGSQIGAWASEQSRPIADRKALDTRVAEVARRFAGGAVPLPDGWGGYLIRPERIELWQGRANRLHDRLLYTRADEGGWDVRRLQP